MRVCKVGVKMQQATVYRLKRQHAVPHLGAACDICGMSSQRLRLDHDHKTGLKRGFLCAPCKKGLGMLRDEPEVLARALNYLTTK